MFLLDISYRYFFLIQSNSGFLTTRVVVLSFPSVADKFRGVTVLAPTKFFAKGSSIGCNNIDESFPKTSFISSSKFLILRKKSRKRGTYRVLSEKCSFILVTRKLKFRARKRKKSEKF